MITISLLRHGEVEGGPCFRGSTDDPLTPEGTDQMREATNAPFSCDMVISSPLIRCARFAQEYASQKALPVQTEHRLSEMHFGDWEGRTSKEIYDQAPKALKNFWNDPEAYPPPHGERLLTFQARVLQAWEEVVENHQNQHTLIVTHGGVIRILLCHLQKIPLAKLMELEVNTGALFSFTDHTDTGDHFELRSQP